MTLLQKIKQQIKPEYKQNGAYYYGFINLLNDIELPATRVDESSDGEDEESSSLINFTEDLDFENFNFVTVNNDKIEFCAGGDWQIPLTITIGLDETDNIVVISHREGYECDSRIHFDKILAKVEL